MSSAEIRSLAGGSAMKDADPEVENCTGVWPYACSLPKAEKCGYNHIVPTNYVGTHTFSNVIHYRI